MQNKNTPLFGVLGLGISGLGTVNFLAKRRYKFIAWDDLIKPENLLKKVKCLSQQNLLAPESKLWESIDILVVSPGIANLDKHPIINKLGAKAKIMCDVELFYSHFPKHKYIAVTGTNGKSSTTKLIEHILKKSGIKAQACGNIGTPILSVNPEKNSVIVVEISSYQLDLIDKFKPNVAVITNVTPDHIERHHSFEGYFQAKQRIFKNQLSDEALILNVDDAVLNDLYKKLSTSGIKPRIVPVSAKNSEIALPENKNLRGQHNAENIVCAYAAVVSMQPSKGASIEIKKAIKTYPGLKHRMQVLKECDGIEFINDSKATNADSTEKALNALTGEIYWLGGGLAKTGGIHSIKPALKKIKAAFLFGKAKKEFSKTFQELQIPHFQFETMEEAFEAAVKAARKSSTKRKIILLSPACASFDQWKSFEERGDYFIKLVARFCKSIKP